MSFDILASETVLALSLLLPGSLNQAIDYFSRVRFLVSMIPILHAGKLTCVS